MKKKTLASFGIVALLSGIPAPGAVYNVEPSNAQAVQDALWQVAVDGEPGEVVVPAGTYVVSEALRIYPGTTLTLDSEAVVLYRGAPSGVMLIGCHFDSKGWPCSGAGCTHGGYSQCHDVVVQGGFWNRNSSSDELSQAFLFRHASGIVIRDMEVANCSNHHFNLSGSEEVVVDNICFSGQVRYTGHDEAFWGDLVHGDPTRYDSIEAIHLDYLDSIGEAGACPLDQTPCRNVLVTNCLFDAVFAGAGVHHLPLGDPARNIRVVDCHFEGLFSYSVYLFGVEDAVVENNTASGGTGLIQSRGSSFRAIGNDISGSKLYGIIAAGGSTATVTGNLFEDMGLRAIHASEKTVLTATRNTIQNTGDNAILLTGCGKSIVDWNTVSMAGKIAILAMDRTPLYARDNTIESPGVHGIATTGGATVNAARNTIRCPVKNGFVLNGGSATLASNRIVSAGLHGVFGENSAKVTANSNTIESPAYCGFSFQSKAKLTAGGKNVVKNPKRQGVLLSAAGASTISGMQITGSESDGIRVVSTDGCTVSKNTVSGVKNKKAGIVMEQCRSGTVTGNTVTGSTGHGIRIFGTKSVPSTVTVSKNKSTGAAAPFVDIILGDWSRKCKVLDNTLGRGRFVISTVGASGNTYRPAGTSITSLASKKKKTAAVKWTTQTGTSGYEIQYSVSKKFPAAKTKSVFIGASKATKTVKNLVAGKKTWFRIRTYHTIGAKKYFSSWSAAKAVKP